MTKKKYKKAKICARCGKQCKNLLALIRHRRRRHPEAVKRAKESSHKNNYGQSAAEFDEQLQEQKNRCSICGREAKNVALHQDHTHSIAKLKIRVACRANGRSKLFTAINDEYCYSYISHSRKKAVRMVRLKLKRRSRRGILCWHCNSGLRKWQQKGGWIDPKHLRRAADYMERWQKEQQWEKQHGDK